MTEFSMFPWETQTGTGDGAASYTQDQANDFFRYFDVRDPANEGVAKGVLNELEVTGAATPLQVNTGAAICYGRYMNDSSVNLAVSTPAVGTTGGRVVLRADWSANEIRLAVKMSADGNASIPALTQTAGTTWEISLATFTVTTGGVITVTDDRTFRMVTGKLGDGDIDDTDMFAAAVITGAKIASETITASNISNRSRKFLVYLPAGYNTTDVAAVTASEVNSYPGLPLEDGKTVFGKANFAVPADFVSGMTIKPVFLPQSGGDLEHSVVASYGAVGEDLSTHSDGSGTQVDTVSADTLETPYTLSLTSVAAGDIVSIHVTRNGGSASDTISDYVVLIGALVEYTADG